MVVRTVVVGRVLERMEVMKVVTVMIVVVDI